MGHGDLDRVVAGSDGAGGEAVALGAKHDGKLRLFCKLLVVDAHRAVAEGHRGSLEAEGMEDVHPLLRPVCRGLAQLPPRHLEHRTHTDADGAAAERVAAGRVDEDSVHVQRRRRAEDGPHIGGVHDALQHGHPAGVFAELFHRAGCRAAEGAEHAPGQLKAGELCQHLPICRVDGGVGAAGQHARGGAVALAALHQKGERFAPGVQRRADDLGAFGDEDAFLRFEAIAQLVLGQPGIRVQLRCVKIRDLDDIGHTESPSFS